MQEELGRLRAEFEATGNGAFAWQAFASCRAAGIEPPPWVMGYLDQVAAQLAALQSVPPTDFVRGAGAALGARLIKESRRSPRIKAAAEWVIGQRGKKDAAVAQATTVYSVSQRAIWEALRRGWRKINVRVKSETSVTGTVLDRNGRPRAVIRDGRVTSLQETSEKSCAKNL